MRKLICKRSNEVIELDEMGRVCYTPQRRSCYITYSPEKKIEKVIVL